MKTFVTAAGLAVGASAAILPRSDECCFQLSASGGTSGTLGQLDDGQNRVGGGLGQATYCINNGKITDESGRGCILTGPTTQFQCDKGAAPQGGFSVNSNGMLQHDGDSTFYACPADQGEYNIYTEAVDDQPKCVEVSLSTGGKCAAQPITSAVTTCPSAQTVTKLQQAKPTTVYKTETVEKTQYKPTTEYHTEYKPTTEYKTEYKPTTVYKTNEETEYVTTTKTMEETEYVTKPTTVYQTKTEQTTVTAKEPTTIYQTQTQTMEETEYVTKPTTIYQTKQETVTAKQPTTVYQTKVVEETQTQQAPATTITKVITSTEQGKPQYVTKTEQYCPNTQPAQTQPAQTGGMPTPTGPANACPTNLDGEYQYPHLIVPVNSEHPDESYGTSYNGMINGSVSSYFNFDVPQSYQGKTCSLVFMFPKKEDLETADYTFNGQGSVAVDHMSSVCKEGDSYNSAPKSDNHMGTFSPQPGNSYTVWTGECPAGSAQSYGMSAEGGLSMDYFQDYNPSPLGLYMTTC